MNYRGLDHAPSGPIQIGNNNVFREGVTVNAPMDYGTNTAGHFTSIDYEIDDIFGNKNNPRFFSVHPKIAKCLESDCEAESNTTSTTRAGATSGRQSLTDLFEPDVPNCYSRLEFTGGGITMIGSECYMALSAHISHDCILEDFCQLTP